MSTDLLNLPRCQVVQFGFGTEVPRQSVINVGLYIADTGMRPQAELTFEEAKTFHKVIGEWLATQQEVIDNRRYPKFIECEGNTPRSAGTVHTVVECFDLEAQEWRFTLTAYAEIKGHWQNDRKIDAIKLLRMCCVGMGLKQAKDICENLFYFFGKLAKSGYKESDLTLRGKHSDRNVAATMKRINSF